MNHVDSIVAAAIPTGTNLRAMALAERLEQGAHALTVFARELSDAQWHARLPGDGRTIGVVVHHVASVYPIEIQLAQTLAGGSPVTGVTWEVVHAMNAAHALEYADVTREATLALLARNSRAAAAMIRDLSDGALAQAAPVSLYADAPLTCQFLLEDHAVRHSYHHLARMRLALAAPTPSPAF
ncbi:MAG: DinB family protein [Acidobacteriota bacterium]